jgi:hypothetical protein
MDEMNCKFKTLGDGIPTSRVQVANPAQRAPFHTYPNIVEHPDERVIECNGKQN